MISPLSSTLRAYFTSSKFVEELEQSDACSGCRLLGVDDESMVYDAVRRPLRVILESRPIPVLVVRFRSEQLCRVARVEARPENRPPRMEEVAPLPIVATGPPQGDAELPFSWRAFLFWPCLLLTGLMYGAVSLTPALRDHLRLRQEAAGRQATLVALDAEVRRLEKLIDALERDPRFREEIRRRNFGQGQAPDEISVDPLLQFAPGPAAPLPAAAVTTDWYAPVIETLATSELWRRRVLYSAAGLCLFAFTFLGERPLMRRRGQGGPRDSWLPDRYRAG